MPKPKTRGQTKEPATAGAKMPGNKEDQLHWQYQRKVEALTAVLTSLMF
jgi:hypothetical protein